MRSLNTRHKYIIIIGVILVLSLIYNTTSAGFFGRTFSSFSNFSCHVFSSGCGGGGGGGGGGKFASLIGQLSKKLSGTIAPSAPSPVLVTPPIPATLVPTTPTTQGQGGSEKQCSGLLGTKCLSPANSCGQVNSSSYKCDGSCLVFSAPDSGCASPTTTTNSPRFDRGSSCTITWSAQNATSCTLTGSGVSVSGISGTVTTPPLQEPAAYTLTCFNGSVVSASKQIICRLNPEYVEF